MNVLPIIQKKTFGFWIPKYPPLVPYSIRIFLFSKSLFVYTVRNSPPQKKGRRFALMTGKEKDRLTLFCALVEEKKQTLDTKRMGDKRLVTNLQKRRQMKAHCQEILSVL